eukprot:scaffold19004_cov101-Skeletonema_marinoi.AAC.2
MDYSLDDYIEQIGLLHQDEQVVDACIEQHSDAAAAAKTNIIERQRRQANTHIIFLSHRSVGNDGLDKLVHAILSANERQMEKESRHRINNDSGSLQQGNGNMYLAKKIHLRCTNIKRGITSLASLLSRSNSTEVLDLSQNELGSDGITELCDGIASQCHEQSSLHSLFLRGCQIGCKGVIAIVSLLVPQHYNPEWAPLPIKTLDLSRNEIGIDGVTALAKAISWDGCSLKALDLSRCNITGERSRGLHRLFSVLLSNARNAAMASANRACVSTKLPSTGNASNLLTLKLNGNDLDSNCFNAIAACISGDSFTDDNNDGKVHYYCPSLKNLYLDNTNMSSLSAKKLAKALVTNTGLKILSLSENLIGDDAAKAFADGLRSNQTLSLLLLGRSKYITQEGVEALATCVYDESHSSALLSLAASNHVIEDFGLGKQTSIRLEHALQFNGNDNDECSVQRKKIASFLNRECVHTMHHFAAFFAVDQFNSKIGRSAALPFVVRHCNLSCAFEVMRGMPEVCLRS